jgi:hypothetical protein
MNQNKDGMPLVIFPPCEALKPQIDMEIIERDIHKIADILEGIMQLMPHLLDNPNQKYLDDCKALDEIIERYKKWLP